MINNCPGCNHLYGTPLSSTPNENGYCQWCRQDGIHDAASQKRDDEKWRAYHAEKEAREAAEHRRYLDENDGCWPHTGGAW